MLAINGLEFDADGEGADKVLNTLVYAFADRDHILTRFNRYADGKHGLAIKAQNLIRLLYRAAGDGCNIPQRNNFGCTGSADF